MGRTLPRGNKIVKFKALDVINKTEGPSVPYAKQGYVTQRIDQATLRDPEGPYKKESWGPPKEL